MSAHHHHEHSHAPQNYNRAFIIGIILNGGFVAIEATYGIFANSLALLADTGHNLSDVLGLVLAWGASILSRRPSTSSHTYGLRRSSILAALFNALFLLLVTGSIAWEAVQRFRGPSSVESSIVIGIAAVGIAINTATALLFVSGRKNDLNIRGAFLHMAADALVSLGVVLAGIAILTTGWLWFDPVVSLIIVTVIVIGTWQLLMESLNLALDGVPTGIELVAVRTYLEQVSEVSEVHHLHIWAISTTETALTVHLVMPTGCPNDGFLTQLSSELHNLFAIDHATIQVETGDRSSPGSLAPHHQV